MAERHRELLDSVGIVTEIEIGEVYERDMQRFAFAVGHLDPRFFPDQDHVPEAPPIFVTGTTGWSTGPIESELRPDGTVADFTSSLPLDGLRLMGAGQDLEFHSRAVAGMRLSCRYSLENIELKRGRSGELLLLTFLREYVDQNNDLTIRCRETMVAR